MTREETTGTPEEEPGDAAESTPTTESPASDGRDAQEGSTETPNAEVQLLNTKAHLSQEVEKRRQLEERLNEIERRSQPPAAPETGDDDEDDVLLRSVEELAARGDPAAKLALRTELRRRQDLARLAHATKTELDIRDIPDKSLRDRAADHLRKNRHRLGDINAAVAEVKQADYEAEIAALNKRLKAIETQPPNTVRTHERDVGVAENKKRKMTTNQVLAEQARLRSLNRHREAMELGDRVSDAD